jgi:3,4-dihydroxy-9,10-secoandrosta-1,3,5(10)-triene-9,17-dione 4,5-dioxygenase
MGAIASLAYLVIGTADIGAWRSFSEALLGAPAADGPSEGGLSLRVDPKYAYSILIEPAVSEGVIAIGWEATSERDFVDLMSRLEANGFVPKEESEAFARERDVDRLFAFEDPDQRRIEVVFGRRWVDEPMTTTRPMDGLVGVGHVLIETPDVEGQLSLYRDILDFKLTDFRSDALYFLRCSPRHHSAAFARSERARTHHFFVETASLDDVGRACDIARRSGMKLLSDLGRHGNDHAISFYVQAPSGIAIEYGWGSIKVDDDSWVPHAYTEGDIWGHWRDPEEAAVVAMTRNTLAAPDGA